MSKIQKLFDRCRNNPTNVSFDDLNTLLTHYEFTCRQPRSGSSHYTYTRKDCPKILTVPRHKPVNETYVKLILKAIEDYGSPVEEE